MEKIRYLEGLRGIAALVVFFLHLKMTCFVKEQTSFYGYISNLEIPILLKIFFIELINKLLNGELAVYVFWVLSSYVISMVFFKKNENYDKILIAYASKRYFRLVIPVLTTSIFAYFLLKFGYMYNQRLAILVNENDNNSFLTIFYNFEPNFFAAIKSGIYNTFFAYSNTSTYNNVLWTIEKEFLGSLFTFSLFGIIRHNSKRYILYALIFVILLQLHLAWLCAFLIGHILCDYDFSIINNKIIDYIKIRENKILKFRFTIFTLSLLFIIFSSNIATIFKISENINMLFLSVLIVYLCLRNSYYQAIFSSKIPFNLGKISFSLYLIHLPILCSLTSYLVYVNNNLAGKIYASAITILVVLVISYFFTTYIDKPSVILANKIGNYFKKYS